MDNNWIERFKVFWQGLPQYIDPVLFRVGPLQIRYYGLMYLACFLTIYGLVLYRIKREQFSYDKETISNYFVWVILGVILGGRVGYVVFYNWQYFIQRPLEIFLPFSFSQGITYTGISGMSYHGGLIGAGLATMGFCYKNKINFWDFVNLIVPAVPLGYTFGRIGNFLNGELYGRVTSMSWGMRFPLAPGDSLRHPSQLYEALFEGVLLFIFLWVMRKKKLLANFMFSLYLIGYGSVRFVLEYFREPDFHIGFVVGSLTTGQLLCLGMILTGSLLLVYRIKKYKTTL